MSLFDAELSLNVCRTMLTADRRPVSPLCLQISVHFGRWDHAAAGGPDKVGGVGNGVRLNLADAAEAGAGTGFDTNSLAAVQQAQVREKFFVFHAEAAVEDVLHALKYEFGGTGDGETVGGSNAVQPEVGAANRRAFAGCHREEHAGSF